MYFLFAKKSKFSKINRSFSATPISPQIVDADSPNCHSRRSNHHGSPPVVGRVVRCRHRGGHPRQSSSSNDDSHDKREAAPLTVAMAKEAKDEEEMWVERGGNRGRGWRRRPNPPPLVGEGRTGVSAEIARAGGGPRDEGADCSRSRWRGGSGRLAAKEEFMAAHRGWAWDVG